MQQENTVESLDIVKNKSITKTPSLVDDSRLRGFTRYACARVLKSHLNRFKESPQIYKLFLSDEAAKVFKLGDNIEMGFTFQGCRGVTYTAKENILVLETYITCEVIPTSKVKGAQTVLYLQDPRETGDSCIIK